MSKDIEMTVFPPSEGDELSGIGERIVADEGAGVVGKSLLGRAFSFLTSGAVSNVLGLVSIGFSIEQLAKENDILEDEKKIEKLEAQIVEYNQEELAALNRIEIALAAIAKEIDWDYALGITQPHVEFIDATQTQFSALKSYDDKSGAPTQEQIDFAKSLLDPVEDGMISTSKQLIAGLLGEDISGGSGKGLIEQYIKAQWAILQKIDLIKMSSNIQIFYGKIRTTIISSATMICWASQIYTPKEYDIWKNQGQDYLSQIDKCFRDLLPIEVIFMIDPQLKIYKNNNLKAPKFKNFYGNDPNTGQKMFLIPNTYQVPTGAPWEWASIWNQGDYNQFINAGGSIEIMWNPSSTDKSDPGWSVLANDPTTKVNKMILSTEGALAGRAEAMFSVSNAMPAKISFKFQFNGNTIPALPCSTALPLRIVTTLDSEDEDSFSLEMPDGTQSFFACYFLSCSEASTGPNTAWYLGIED